MADQEQANVNSGAAKGGKGNAGKKKQDAKTIVRRKKRAAKLKKDLKLSVPVPEGLKKAWERENRTILLRKRRDAAIKKRRPEKRAKQAKRIERYEKVYDKIKESRQKSVTQARLDGNIFKPADAKVAIVVRIRGINRVSPKVRRVLQLFRLLQIHNAVFIKVNKATINMLKLIQPYVAYGYVCVVSPNASFIACMLCLLLVLCKDGGLFCFVFFCAWIKKMNHICDIFCLFVCDKTF